MEGLWKQRGQAGMMQWMAVPASLVTGWCADELLTP